ncbi:hypothetical protein M758_9G052100 [Ceratodon purpureus]|nr:hypothetical protein M758_9G052100 [Ceratodon purpureus]
MKESVNGTIDLCEDKRIYTPSPQPQKEINRTSVRSCVCGCVSGSAAIERCSQLRRPIIDAQNHMYTFHSMRFSFQKLLLPFSSSPSILQQETRIRLLESTTSPCKH